MTSFKHIIQQACKYHGDLQKIEKAISPPLSAKFIRKIADDRWLSAMSKCIFQAGFNWKLVEDKWPYFEDAFSQFKVNYLTLQSDEDIEKLMDNDRIVRHYAKLKSIRENAYFIQQLNSEYSGAGQYFSSWEIKDYVINLSFLHKNTARLGGKTGQIFLRRMGVDTLIFTPDVVEALTHLNILEGKLPGSKKSWAILQESLDSWHVETGFSLNKISQLLALSTGPKSVKK